MASGAIHANIPSKVSWFDVSMSEVRLVLDTFSVTGAVANGSKGSIIRTEM